MDYEILATYNIPTLVDYLKSWIRYMTHVLYLRVRGKELPPTLRQGNIEGCQIRPSSDLPNGSSQIVPTPSEETGSARRFQPLGKQVWNLYFKQ